MTTRTTPRDWELISSYIDGELKAKDRAHCEARLKNEPELRQILEEMRFTRTMVRRLEPLRAPRNFTLTPEMAGTSPRSFRPLPAFQWASAIATLLFILVVAGDFMGFLGPRLPSLPAAPASISADATAPAAGFALQAESMEAEMAPLEEEDPAQGAVEEFATEVVSQEVNGTPEPSSAAGDTIQPLPLTPDGLEAGSLSATESAQFEGLEARTGAGSGTSVGNLQLRILEAALAAIALITALAALALRRRML
jgi:hypothetical protein